MRTLPEPHLPLPPPPELHCSWHGRVPGTRFFFEVTLHENDLLFFIGSFSFARLKEKIAKRQSIQIVVSFRFLSRFLIIIER